jgi:hypothetical protein
MDQAAEPLIAHPADLTLWLSNERRGLCFQIASVARGAACVGAAWARDPKCPQGWSSSVLLPRRLFTREAVENVDVVTGIRRAAVSGELARIDFDLLDSEPLAAALRGLLRAEIEPFIIGVGHVRVDG